MVFNLFLVIHTLSYRCFLLRNQSHKMINSSSFKGFVKTKSGMMVIRKLINYLSVLFCCFLFSACGGGGGGGGVDSSIASNPEFLEKSAAINFNQVTLYKDHINENDVNRVMLDVNNLASGELISIDVEFEIIGNLENYSLLVQLVPESVFNQLTSGNTVGDVINGSDIPVGDFIDLGGVYIDTIQPGILHGIVHAKLPVLEFDTTYKILVTPSIDFLASGKPINNDDLKSMPVFLDNTEIVINRLDAISVKIVGTADLLVDNEFTQLEVGGGFDSNGFSLEPIFQTTIEMDVTSFNEAEEIVLSLSWAQSPSSSFPLALLTTDAVGNPVISEDARITVKRTNETSVTIPVVAYVTEQVQTALLKDATSIRDIADQTVKNGNFTLAVNYVENGEKIDTGSRYNFSMPMVSQDNRVLALSAEQVVNFTVLRAGSTNAACLVIHSNAFDVETNYLSTDAIAELIATPCPAPGELAEDKMLWRYDLTTKQIISKEKDINNDSYCIEWADQVPNPNSFIAVDFNVRKCKPDTSSTNLGHISQRFIFENNKIRNADVPVYIDVILSANFVKEVSLVLVDLGETVTTPDFFRNSTDVTLDQYGRIFYVGKFFDSGWGNEDIARVSLSYGGESFADYLPVLGVTSQGHTTLSASLFGFSADLIDANFALKRYFPKKLSLVGNNAPDIIVGNGGRLKIDIAGFATLELGELIETPVTETYDPAGNAGDFLAEAITQRGTIDRSATPVTYKMDAEYVRTTIVIGFIPVTIKGGVSGDVNVAIDLTSPGVGFDVSANENFTLGAFVSASVATADVIASLEVINQSITFTALAGFNTPAGITELSLDIGSSLLTDLSLLKGEVIGSVKYPSPCACVPPYKTKKLTKVFYSSDYLFNKDWTIYNHQPISPILIEL